MNQAHSKSLARKQSKWTYILVAIAAVALVAMAWTVYRNPKLFKADILPTCDSGAFLDKAQACSGCGAADCSGLVSYWKFDDADLTVTDSKGSNNGSIPKKTAATWVSGKKGKSLNFDGISDFVTVPNNSNLNLPSGSFTISAWVKIDACGVANRTLLQRTHVPGDGSGYNFWLAGNGGVPMAKLQSNTTASSLKIGAENLVPITCNAWNHLVWTANKSNSEQRVYMNGVSKFPSQSLAPFSSMNFTNATHDLFIGMGYSSDGSPMSPFKGWMDELTLWNRALSASEVSDLYKFGNCGNGTVDTGEACDDGNAVAGDGCSASCTVEQAVMQIKTAPEKNVILDNTNFDYITIIGESEDFPNIAAKCTAGHQTGGVWIPEFCYCDSGYTKISGTKTCSEKNECTAGTDNCNVNATCTNTAGSFTCACKAGYTGDGVTCAVAAVCGNGATESGEACDDGNVVTETCPTYDVVCSVCNSQCQSGPGVKLFCGDLVKNGTEECDGSVPAGKTCATEVGQGSTGTLRCTDGASGCRIDKTACSAAACVPATCFTDVEASKVDDYLLGFYTLTAGEAVKFDTNCNGSVTDGDAGYISDHASSTCP